MHNVTSPNSSDDLIEQAIQAAGAPAPRVTPQMVDEAIASEHYFTASEGAMGASGGLDGGPRPLHLLTFCVLVLHNGFTVTGESACRSPENFNSEIGKNIARDKARDKIWPLLGYALADYLACVRESNAVTGSREAAAHHSV